MVPELLDMPRVWTLLCGTSMILSVEPEVEFAAALRRAQIAEDRSDAELDQAISLIVKVRHELGLNGSEQPDRKQAREILKHILKDPPWHGGSDKHDVI